MGPHALTYFANDDNTLDGSYSSAVVSSSVTDNGDGNFYVSALSTATIVTNTIYIVATNNLGISGVSSAITVKISCTPTSTSITEGAYADPSSHTDLQIVQASNTGPQKTYFVHPTISLTDPLCPITSAIIVLNNVISDPHSSLF